MTKYKKTLDTRTVETDSPSTIKPPSPTANNDANAKVEIYNTLCEKKLILTKRPPIRSSSIRAYTECPRKFLFGVRWGLKPNYINSPALTVGNCFHALFEYALKTTTKESALIRGAEWCGEEVAKLEDLADVHGLLPDGTQIELQVAKHEQAFSLAQAMFEVSYELFFKSALMVSGGWEVLDVEIPLQVNVRNPSATLRCKPDALLIRPRDGAMCVMDHKTTGKSARSLTHSLTFHPQVWLTHICLKALFPDCPEIHYVHNIIQKPTIKYPSRNNPTYEQYVESCKTWYETKGKDPETCAMLQNHILFLNSPWSDEVQKALQLVSSASRGGKDWDNYTRNADACMGPFGSRKCAYFDLCHSHPLEWEQTIKKKFTAVSREDEEDKAFSFDQ